MKNTNQRRWSPIIFCGPLLPSNHSDRRSRQPSSLLFMATSTVTPTWEVLSLSMATFNPFFGVPREHCMVVRTLRQPFWVVSSLLGICLRHVCCSSRFSGFALSSFLLGGQCCALSVMVTSLAISPVRMLTAYSPLYDRLVH